MTPRVEAGDQLWSFRNNTGNTKHGTREGEEGRFSVFWWCSPQELLLDWIPDMHERGARTIQRLYILLSPQKTSGRRSCVGRGVQAQWGIPFWSCGIWGGSGIKVLTGCATGWGHHESIYTKGGRQSWEPTAPPPPPPAAAKFTQRKM